MWSARTEELLPGPLVGGRTEVKTLPIVGLTGNIACGKSSVAERLRALGAAVVDADEVARAVVEPGSAGLDAVVAEFGDEILRADGSLDRSRLGERVFGDEDARAKLNGILHPRIAIESARRIANLQTSGAPYIVYEAALLVENGTHKSFAALVVVTLDEELQMSRLMARDDSSQPAALARIRAQMPQGEKAAEADHIIDNSGDAEALSARVAEVHRALLATFDAEGA